MILIPNLKIKSKPRRIAILTSGGDAPGMNAAVRAAVRFGIAHSCSMMGIIKGFHGLLEDHLVPLNASSVANVIHRGGTILKTARCKEFYKKSARKKAATILRDHQIDGLIVIGGDGSFCGAHLLQKESGIPVIGVPGTIDNDIPHTDESIGFDTAVNTAIEAIDRIRDTANSHDRIFLVEVMGRNSGFLGLQVGIAGGAETMLLPEKRTSLQKVCATIDRGIRRGKMSSIIVVSEGPIPGRAVQLQNQLNAKGYQSRVCILGHTQRGGTPTAQDRTLGTVLGASAVAYLLSGKSNAMVGVQAQQVVFVPFSRIIGKRKDLSQSMLRMAEIVST